MTTISNKLSKLTLKQLIFINSAVIIISMIIISSVCPDGLIGGECAKELDNKMFLLLIIANLVFAVYCIYKTGKNKLGILALNLFLTVMFYTIAGTIHSISKAGLF